MSKSTQNLNDLASDLIFSMPKELILDGKIELSMKNEIISIAKKINPDILITTFDSPHNPKVFLETMLDVQSLDGFGDALKDGKEIAISLLLNYLQSLNKSSKPICSVIREANNSDNVIFDRQSLANLEVFESTYNHNIRHSLR
jgi:DNA mismatch repair ATPase MutS